MFIWLYTVCFIYILSLKFYVPVGWLVGLFVLLVGSFVRTFTHQWEGGLDGSYVSPGMNLAGVISGSGHIQVQRGAEGPPAPREKFKYLRF